MKTKEKITKDIETVESWRELSVSQIQQFQEILTALNRYYKMMTIDNKVSKTQLFREKVEKADAKTVSVELKRFGEYEYLVRAIVDKETDTWIHVDGIAEERKTFPKNNPIFNIVCLTDIYQQAV